MEPGSAFQQDQHHVWQSEIRHSFIRHAPDRIKKTAKKCQKLYKSGWDINLLAILQNESAILAGQLGQAGLIPESQLLHELEVTLEKILKDERLPEHEESKKIQAICDQILKIDSNQPDTETDLNIDDLSFEAEAEAKDIVTNRENTPIQLKHQFSKGPDYPPNRNAILIQLPVNAWLRSDQLDTHTDSDGDQMAELSDTPPETASGHFSQNPETTPVQTTEEHILSLLGPKLLETYTQDFMDLGYPLQSVATLQDLTRALKDYSGHCILVSTDVIEDTQAFKSQLTTFKNKLDQSVSALVLSGSTDISHRIKAMRMGADTYFKPPFSPLEVIEKIQALSSSKESKQFKILIVEDDESQAKFAASILKKAGMETRYVLNPLEAFDVLAEFPPDLILMDLYLPDVDGTELTMLIRENEQFISTPIVFLSGEQDEEKQFHALEMGGDDFLEKPIRPKHLISAVQNRIQRARSIQDRLIQSQSGDGVSGLFQRSTLIDMLNDQLDSDDLSNKAFVFFQLANRITVKEDAGYAQIDGLMNQLGLLIDQISSEYCKTARFGEFSFAMLCTQTDSQQLGIMGEDICTQIKNHDFDADGTHINLVVKAGATILADLPRDAAKIISVTEKTANSSDDDSQILFKLIQANRRASSEQKDEKHILKLVRDAIEEDNLPVLFQPLINLKDNKQEQYQTLLRLLTPEQDFIPASRFIPIAEKHHLLPKLDRWVIKRAMDIISHRERLNRPIRLFVNQSGQTLQEVDYGKFLQTLMTQFNIQSTRLCIEISLDQLLLLGENAKQAFSAIHECKTQVSVSQFDGHQSSFDSIDLPGVQFIKLLPAMIADENRRDEFEQTLTKAHTNHLQVIAPRVEHAMNAAIMWTSGVDYLQGNFIQQPDSKMQFDFQSSAF